MKNNSTELLERAAHELEQSVSHIQAVINQQNYEKDDQPEGVGSAEEENTITEGQIYLSSIVKDIESVHKPLVHFIK